MENFGGSGAQSPTWEEVFPELRSAVPGEGGEELAQHFSRARFALDRR